MKTSDRGIALITSFEGLRLKAYKAVPTEKYYTIGYGHYGADVTPTMTITKAQAENFLKTDLAKFESKVNRYNSTYAFNQNEYDALVSFCYNVGNIDQLTANGKRNRAQIASSMLLYVKSGGKVLKGLQTRREKERALFLTPIATKTKSIDTLANEVIKGVWGVGAERRIKLEKAGYNYRQVQDRVNEILRGK